MSAYDVTVMALSEAGRPDLAELLLSNRAGDPRFDRCRGLARDDLRLIHKAATLGHQAAGTTIAEDNDDAHRLLDYVDKCWVLDPAGFLGMFSR